MAELDLVPYDEYVSQLPRKCVSAGVLIRDTSGRVLLVQPSYKPGWEIPGGVVEDGEAPWSTAFRELAEEVSLERSRGRLLVIDHVAEEADGMPERLAFIFDGGKIEPDELSRLVFSPEIIKAELCDLEQVRTRAKPVLADRVVAALDALSDGAPAMCERGKRV